MTMCKSNSEHGNVSPVWVVCLVLSVCGGAARAELTWERTTYEHSAGLAETQVVAAFPFTNKGGRPVTITQVSPSCGCTAAKLDKKTYAPGESDRITVTFEYGTRTGRQVKTISVTTDDEDQPHTQLSIRVKIPKPVKLGPRFVYWKHGEARESKAIRVEAADAESIKVKSVRIAEGKGFTADIRAVREGRSYEVIVTPSGDEDFASAESAEAALVKGVRLSIATELDGNQSRAFDAFARMIPERVEPPLGRSPLGGGRGGRLFTLPIQRKADTDGG